MNRLVQPCACVSLFLRAGCLGLLVAVAPAQATKYAVTPAGCEFHPGNYNNTFPFAGVSAHYPQIHDTIDMAALNGGGVMLITHIGFRPAAAYTITARAWDVQLSLSPTSVNAAAMSATFSANVTTTPTVVLPYTTVNAPAGQGAGATVPNKILWNFPFKSLFIYAPGPGRNLLWEWQSKNAATSPARSWMRAADPARRPPGSGRTPATAAPPPAGPPRPRPRR